MKTVIEMAREAGFSVHEGIITGGASDLERFAELVRADEREACAKEAESWGCDLAAAEIRLRSNT